MTFQYPAVLFLLLLLPAAVGLFFWRDRVRRQRLERVGEADLLGRLIASASRWQRVSKAVLWLAAAAMMIIALARPVWGVDVDIIETQGAAVMIVLDVSNSMNAQDVLPSRLERAKLSVRSLVDRLQGNEVGLIVFAGAAVVQFPLTTDLTSAVTFINAASSAAISRQGTNIGAALKLAQESFDSRRAAQRMVILISDGENFEGDPAAAIETAAQAGITIHTIGYGDTRGEPVPLVDAAGNMAGFKSVPSGDVVLSALDEITLRAAAERTGGLYRRAAPDGSEINDIVKAIQQRADSRLENRAQNRGVERAGIFVALALLALSLEMLLPEPRREAA